MINSLLKLGRGTKWEKRHQCHKKIEKRGNFSPSDALATSDTIK